MNTENKVVLISGLKCKKDLKGTYAFDSTRSHRLAFPVPWLGVLWDCLYGGVFIINSENQLQHVLLFLVCVCVYTCVMLMCNCCVGQPTILDFVNCRLCCPLVKLFLHLFVIVTLLSAVFQAWPFLWHFDFSERWTGQTKRETRVFPAFFAMSWRAPWPVLSALWILPSVLTWVLSSSHTFSHHPFS